MQVAFLGGASGVGASCVAIELAEQWIVVDAGVRTGNNADPLPDLAQLEGKDVRAIFVTHAHADHIGALPLLHRAFPTTPIFASRGTMLLMEVMLADALRVMARRAAEEMELPLYPESLVAGMLTQVRPLPVGESLTLPMLPGITIQASRAGHIAGAVSIAFEAADGSIVVSGDISSTPQRTVPGAVPPSLKRCDLLVLESTYGARLHPNRQAEEQRLAQAVAEGLERGGHVLIPCFGLGRGQEILLLLQAAQEQGQIPDFPIYVDGLVRRVCTTYQLIPEFLTPRLQRQIRKGYLPFSGPNITFMRDERERERILAGSPACILSSSGMLTGGPSVWYASRLASDPNASILITGYQDEESPGRKLLDLAEQKRNTLELNGQQVQVQCTVAKYSLSAHADGGELAAFAAALKPRTVALVHGDEEARNALRSLLSDTEVVLPLNGSSLTLEAKKAKKRAQEESAAAVVALPRGIGGGKEFEYPDVERLWRAVVEVPTLRIVTARELALVWYGEATEETTESILYVLAQDYEQRYFIHQSALEEAYRVRGQQEELAGDFLSDLPGSIILLLVSPESAKPAICRSIEPGAAVRAYLPRGVSQERTRFPFSAILEVLGPAPQDILHSYQSVSAYLADLVKAMRRIRRSISAHSLARQCEEDVAYTLSDLCAMAGLFPQSLHDRLALAKVLQQHPRLFVQDRDPFEGEGLTLYGLASEWREALEEPEEFEKPDQHWILSVIERYVGSPPDLYRRSVDPDTGAVVLYFHFPERAQERYAEAVAAASDEAGAPISFSPNAHQGALASAARQYLPESLRALGTPSFYFDRSVVSLRCMGQVTEEDIIRAQTRFYEKTGWYLELEGATIIRTASSAQAPEYAPLSAPASVKPPESIEPDISCEPAEIDEADEADESDTAVEISPVLAAPLIQHEAMQVAQRMLSRLPGYQKVGVDVSTGSLLLRFHFPLAAQTKYATIFEELERRTGWHVSVNPATNQQALAEMARQVLPAGLVCDGTPSIRPHQQKVSVQCVGNVEAEAIEQARQRFLDETGWQLELILPEKRTAQAPVMVQGEAMSLASEKFRQAPDFYRVGADGKKGILWLHFYFPDIARQRYKEQLADVAHATGWRVYVYPYVNRAALIDAARRLLPEGIGIDGKATVYEDSRTLHLMCTGPVDAQTRERIQQQFTEETGWMFDLRSPADEYQVSS